MSLLSWLASKLNGAAVPVSGPDLAEIIEEYAGDVAIREMAFWSGVNLITGLAGKCEFKTFAGGKEVKGREWYLWNVEPNRNQNSTAFIHKWLSTLYRKNEALVIEQSGQLLVADSFTRRPYALLDDIFEQVTVGDFTFRRSFNQSEVLYFQLSYQDMRQVTDQLYNSYSKLIFYAVEAFQRSRGTKGTFEYDTLPVAGTDQRKAFDKLINEDFKSWLKSDKAVIALGKGQKFTELTHKTYSNESTRDIRAMVDDIFDFTARALKIPPVLLNGKVEGVGDAVNLMLTTCMDPLFDTIQEEINRKRSGFAGMQAGTYVQIDTTAVKHIDLLDIATPVEKLIGSGLMSVNDILKHLGKPTIDEPWANEHFFTKNFTTIEEALLQAAQKGGG